MADVTQGLSIPESPRACTRMAPEDRRANIIAAADRVFDGRDPADVTFEEIASAAGVSRALVYNYFGDKGGLVAAVYIHSLDGLDEEVRTTLASGLSPEARFRYIIRVYLEWAQRHAGNWEFLGSASTNQHPLVREARERRYRQLAEAWGGTAEARITMAGMVGLIEASVLDWLHADHIDIDRATELIHAMLWTGVSSLDVFGVRTPESHAAT